MQVEDHGTSFVDCAGRSRRAELRRASTSGGDVVEHHLDRHADAHRVGRALDDVGQQARPLVELDDRQHVRQLLAEAGRLVLVGHGEACRRCRVRSRAPTRSPTTGTPGRRRAAAARVVPQSRQRWTYSSWRWQRLPVAARLLVDARQRLPVALRLRLIARSQDHGHAAVPLAEHAAGAVARARSRVRAPAPRRARRAAACTASITRKMPRMPGWFDDSPPPSVLTGSAPPRPMRPLCAERAALAGLAEAERSRASPAR